MSFRVKHRLERTSKVGIQRSQIDNHRLYAEFRSIATRVMCDMYTLNVDDCDKIPQAAVDYRENLLEAMVGAVILNEVKK